MNRRRCRLWRRGRSRDSRNSFFAGAKEKTHWRSMTSLRSRYSSGVMGAGPGVTATRYASLRFEERQRPLRDDPHRVGGELRQGRQVLRPQEAAQHVRSGEALVPVRMTDGAAEARVVLLDGAKRQGAVTDARLAAALQDGAADGLSRLRSADAAPTLQEQRPVGRAACR